MKAAYVTEYGPAEAIRYGELPDPSPGPGEVLVRTTAATVNHVDTFLRAGALADGPYVTEVEFPLIVGRDAGGTIVSTGPDITDAQLAPGAAVWTSSLGYDGRPGAAAELVRVEAARCYRVPPGLDAAVPTAAAHAGTTAVLALRRAGLTLPTDPTTDPTTQPHSTAPPASTPRSPSAEPLRPVGQPRVYVRAAGGAVGRALVDVAVTAGAEVIASARDSDSLDHLAAAGAQPLDSRSGREEAELPTMAVDILIDTSGTLPLAAAVSALRPGGRIVSVTGPPEDPLPVRQLYLKDASVLGFVLSRATAAEIAYAATHVNALLSAGRLRIPIAARLPLSATAHAHHLVESAHPRGKILLIP